MQKKNRKLLISGYSDSLKLHHSKNKHIGKAISDCQIEFLRLKLPNDSELYTRFE